MPVAGRRAFRAVSIQTRRWSSPSLAQTGCSFAESDSAPSGTVRGMLPSLYAALSLSIIYRVTINLPDLTYTSDLQSVGSKGFLQSSREIAHAVDRLLSDLPASHNASILHYRYES